MRRGNSAAAEWDWQRARCAPDGLRRLGEDIAFAYKAHMLTLYIKDEAMLFVRLVML